MKKIVKIDGKTYTVDLDTKELEEVEEKEEEKVETPATEEEEVETTETDEEVSNEKIDAAAQKVMKSLGIDKLKEEVKNLTKTVTTNTPEKKISALCDLEKLMSKDISEMTVKEKIVGFFQGMMQSNHAVLKALSEGTAADGGYLFPEFVGELKSGELLGSPYLRIISHQAIA